MPSATTQPTTEAGRRLLSVPWASGEQAGLDLRDDVLAIEAEAAAAERAAIWAAIAQERGDGWDAVARTDIVAILNAREPRP